jgi:DNA-directed RNA polymerase subunit RPC12/RpoP
MRQDHYLSLFFVPLFPVKKGEEFWACTRCENLCSGPEAARHYTSAKNPTRPDACPKCGHKTHPDFTFCPNCGQRL